MAWRAAPSRTHVLMADRTIILLRLLSNVDVNSLINVLRLFSMFPTGAPGIALLLLRISLAAAILDGGSDCMKSSLQLLISLALGAQSLLLCLGLLIPIVSVVACTCELTALFVTGHPDVRFIALSSLNAAAIALLGPGAYSLDARLFGRREIVFPPSGKDKHR